MNCLDIFRFEVQKHCFPRFSVFSVSVLNFHDFSNMISLTWFQPFDICILTILHAEHLFVALGSPQAEHVFSGSTLRLPLIPCESITKAEGSSPWRVSKNWSWSKHTDRDPRPRITPRVMALSVMGVKLGVFGFFVDHTHTKTNAKQMRQRSSRAKQRFTHVYLRTLTAADAGYIHIWWTTVIL